MPDLYNLFWYHPFFDGEHLVPLQEKAVVGLPFFVPAIVLYPALMTPAIFVRGGDPDMFEVLLMGPADPEIKADVVARHLHIGIGLDPQRRIPLFLPDGAGKISVTEVKPDGDQILRTETSFKGILDPRFLKRADDAGYKRFYKVQMAGSYLPPPDVPPADGKNAEPQDLLIQAVLKKFNGPALQGQGGRGTHCFRVLSNEVDVTRVDESEPIQAYHPLFVYRPGELGYARVGHVSDIHLNARQEVLHRSSARVIDAPQAEADSPPVGSLMNVCGHSLGSILTGMARERADVLLVGGDLIDHIYNAYPFQHKASLPSTDRFPAKKVWDLVNLDKDYAKNYQAFVDHLSFFSVIRSFSDTYRIPVFGITGNHDCYKDAFGTSPRLAWMKPNEGIPADHNLTFYEAILIFGESFHDIVSKMNFKPKLFEWFYAVFTPFTDFVVDLPKQRVAALAWGEAEELISGPGSYGQGFGHLPRAKEAVTPAQLALFKDGFDAAKRTVLMTHFTFVSYDDRISIDHPGEPNALDLGTTGIFRRGDPFTPFDMGTFEKLRLEIYNLARDVPKMQCIVTGHSHRKGLYFLSPPAGDKAPSEMYSFHAGLTPAARDRISARTPIIVSDSAGPLPRLNLRGEFRTPTGDDGDKKAWGSDRPAGTLIDVDGTGMVTGIKPVQSTAPGARPRLAVALDYHNVMNQAVFQTFQTTDFLPKDFIKVEPDLIVTLHPSLTSDPKLRIKIDGIVLYCKTSIAVDWKSATAFKARAPNSWRVEPKFFHEWCTMPPKAGRFISFRLSFDADAGEIAAHYDESTAWNLEVEAKPKNLEFFGSKMRYSFGLPPKDGESDSNQEVEVYDRPTVEGPSFDWRRKLPQYQ